MVQNSIGKTASQK